MAKITVLSVCRDTRYMYKPHPTTVEIVGTKMQHWFFAKKYIFKSNAFKILLYPRPILLTVSQEHDQGTYLNNKT